MLYRRWRHTRGFGVHSPLAYQCVRRVLIPGRGYSWYAYEDIEIALETLPATAQLPGEENRLRQKGRFALRLADFCRPSFVVAHPGVSSVVLAGIRGGGYRIAADNGEAEKRSDTEKWHEDRGLTEGRGLHIIENKIGDEAWGNILRNGSDILYFSDNSRNIAIVSQLIKAFMSSCCRGGVMIEGRKMLILMQRSEMALHEYKVL
ncbi:MAG: hypothetical protein K2N03_08740 [Muribaculaceae bacterium]|nr:hypothetical protein [Muribaculaceae bacterium]